MGVLGWLQRCDMMPDGKANVEILMGPRVKIKNAESEMFGEDSLKWLTVEVILIKYIILTLFHLMLVR